MEPISIRALINDVLAGQIRIPAFQRGFVWEPDRVAQLMDSIYKRYPFGAVLFWRTREKLRVERNLGPFQLPPPRADYPIDYVLDGQQRITSIFGVFQNELPRPTDERMWKDVYFDVTAIENPQDTQFFALPLSEVEPRRHFPLRTLFDTVGYRQATADFSDPVVLERIDAMQSIFKEVQIPFQTVKTEEKSKVAIIFERINRQAVRLDTLQLLSAWTWSDDFDLHRKFQELADELDQYGFEEEVSEENLLLRCAAAILVGDADPEALIGINGAEVRNNFETVVNGIKGALDYLNVNLKVEKIANLPFQTLLVPLSVFFAVPNSQSVMVNATQRQTINRWFWRSCFNRRYSSGVLRNLKEDISGMNQLKSGKPSNLNAGEVKVWPHFFVENEFGLRNVNTKTFILMLAQRGPLNFISGMPIDLARKLKDYNRTEYHHLFPRAFLEVNSKGGVSPNYLVNFAFLSSIENKHLGGVAPSLYKSKMASNLTEILEKSLCPESLFSDNYVAFVSERAELLCKYANDLVGNAETKGYGDLLTKP